MVATAQRTLTGGPPRWKSGAECHELRFVTLCEGTVRDMAVRSLRSSSRRSVNPSSSAE